MFCVKIKYLWILVVCSLFPLFAETNGSTAFNQLKIIKSPRASGLDGSFVVLLPSDEPESVELFCVREGRPLEQLRVRRDLSDWEDVSRRVRNLHHNGIRTTGPLAEGDAADLEILMSWVARNVDDVNRVDMQAAGSAEDGLRLLGGYIRGCDLEGWEKVWRI